MEAASRGAHWRLRVLTTFLLGATLVAVPAGPVSAAVTTQPGFTITLLTSSPNLRAPDSLKFGPDGRLYVLEQNRGAVRIVQNDVMLATPLITIPVQTGGSRGLLGIAFDPNYVSNGHFYLNYTTDAGGLIHNRLSMFTAVGNTANPNTEVVLFDGEDIADKTMHYGADINVGPDGKLYVSTGDRLNGANSQNMNTTWGKMLRFNLDGSIPTDNPFYAQTTGDRRAIWALGLRNPFKFTFQKGTGRMFIGDVGSSTWEEIDDGARGANYGWATYEGPSNAPGFTSPLFAFNHSVGDPTGCAVMGGDFYNPTTVTFPSQFVGTYIFAELCSGWVKSLDFNHGNQLRDILTGLEQPVDLKVGNNGSLYIVTRVVDGVVGGGLWRVDYTGSTALSISQQPQNVTSPIGGDATFFVAANGIPPFGYQWQRNGVDIPGATSDTYTLSNTQPSDTGATFRVRVSAGASSVMSNTATLIVTTNHRPTASIDTPLIGTTYAAGMTYSYSGSETDLEDGTTIPASNYTWSVVFHHNTHTHDFLLPFSGVKSGTFTIPTDNETSSDVWYRIHLTVTDSGGASHEVTRDILPQLSQVTLQTNPPGLQLNLDDSPVASGTTFTGVEGITRKLEAPSPQTLGGLTYVFQGWSDSGAALHTISTPTNDTTYTATFTQSTAAKKALLVVGDPANLGPEQQIVDRLAALGFVVTLRDDDFATGTDALGQDIVVIASSVNEGKVRTGFRDVSVPVMVFKPWLYDDMRMTGTVGNTDFGVITGQRTVNVQAIAHPLAPNGAETLTILSAVNTLPWGKPAATADVVGRTGAFASLFTYSPGDLLFGGTPAPGCRVGFPLYKTAIVKYTAVGWDLFNRTVNWETGGCQGAP